MSRSKGWEDSSLMFIMLIQSIPINYSFVSSWIYCSSSWKPIDPFEPEPPFLRRECTFLRGFSLTPASISPDGLTAVYVANSLPITSGRKKISFVSIQAKCRSNGPRSAPTCNWTVTLGFCDSSGTCTSSDRTYRHGAFNASGTGPAAYTISGGTQSFRTATGSINSVLDLSSFDLDNVSIFICYPIPVVTVPTPPRPTPAPVPTRPTIIDIPTLIDIPTIRRPGFEIP